MLTTASVQPVPVSSFVASCAADGHGMGRTLAPAASKRWIVGGYAVLSFSTGGSTTAGDGTTTINRLGRPTSPPDPGTG